MSKSTLSEIVDLFLLRVTPPEGETERPYYTTGSIVAAALFRLTLILFLAMLFNDQYRGTGWWWTAVTLAAWGIGAYPAWLQYRRFNEDVRVLQENTLCGSCRHFNPTNQLCTVLDVHVTSNEPPCGGDEWEPLQ